MPAYDVLFDTAGQQLDEQLPTADTVATKSATIFTIASTVAAVVPALLPFGKTGFNLESETFRFLFFGIVAYVLCLLFFTFGYSTGNWDSGPSPDALARVCSLYDSDEVRGWVGAAYLLSLRRNTVLLDEKISCYNWLFVMFVVEVATLMVAGLTAFQR